VAESNIKFEVVSPIGEPNVQPEPPATQINDFRGKTIGQVWNAGLGCQVFRTWRVAEAARYQVVPWTGYYTQQRMDANKNMEDIRQSCLKGCDA
jgi:hypothetical protein